MKYQKRKLYKLHGHITKYFPAYDISNKKVFKIQALMGFKPITKYFSASEISKEKAYEILKGES